MPARSWMAGAIVLSFAFPGYATAQAIKIGVIGMMTGPGAAWGIAAAEAARFAAEEANAAGGLDVNGAKRKVEVIVYDDQYKASESLAAYNRLVNEDGAKFFMTMSSAAMLAMTQDVERDNVLVLTGSYSRKVINADIKHIIRMYSTPTEYMEGAIRWMKGNLPGKRVAIVNPNDETGWDITDVSARGFAKEGYEVITRELYDRTQKDFQPLLTRVIAMQPDFIELGSSSPALAGLIVRQARELGYKNAFSALGGPGPREIVAAAGAAAAEGMVNILYADPANKAYQELSERFQKKIGQPPNEFIVPCYDSVKVLLKAISLSGDPDNAEKVAGAFAKALPMKSLQGQDLSFGGKSTMGTDAQIMTVNYIGQIRNGQPVAVGVTK
ncbi:amino acid/amide ABC transporter substrate-binding protein, HAAT family [Azospirillum oryzae]|uniref:Amino acid/amide ABC transporter substrate-binding protein, HAAT family n=1 Tax=Azospirillum oryzae TaxID=286727 RepID=A0A1X7HNJ0_9PROT|nr:ABC transporter substrate-binding protein [Azospirillum oryzae]SMF89985.1 amino acid/amide ABC transporter substrate-binding protein, HAAT family [Azospirillum oryzae]